MVQFWKDGENVCKGKSKKEKIEGVRWKNSVRKGIMLCRGDFV